MTQPSYREIASPASEQIGEIVDGLQRFGAEQIDGAHPERIAVVSEGEGRQLLGGAVGHSLLHRFYLTQLWVAEASRSRGIGQELMRRVEAVARQRECRDVVVDTLNREAVRFYERLGYTVYLVNPDYVSGFDWHFLAKEMTPEAY